MDMSAKNRNVTKAFDSGNVMVANVDIPADISRSWVRCVRTHDVQYARSVTPSRRIPSRSLSSFSETMDATLDRMGMRNATTRHMSMKLPAITASGLIE